jgi:hypothetical protein
MPEACCVCANEIRPRLFAEHLLGRPVHHRCKSQVLNEQYEVSFCSSCDTYPKLYCLDGYFTLTCSCAQSVKSTNIVDAIDLWNGIHNPLVGEKDE